MRNRQGQGKREGEETPGCEQPNWYKDLFTLDSVIQKKLKFVLILPKMIIGRVYNFQPSLILTSRVLDMGVGLS